MNPDDGSDFVVLRVAADGTSDSTFGTDGVARLDFAGFADGANAVIQQTDGKLVLAGVAELTFGIQDIALARFNADGTLDATFGNGGKTTLDFGGSHDFASDLIQQSDGKFVIAGGTISGGHTTLFSRDSMPTERSTRPLVPAARRSLTSVVVLSLGPMTLHNSRTASSWQLVWYSGRPAGGCCHCACDGERGARSIV